MKLLTLLSALPLLLASSETGPGEVAQTFIDEVLVGRDMQTAARIFADDMLFTDPTTAVWGMPLAQGVRGKQAIIELMTGFNTATVVFAPNIQFSSGPYACFVGRLSMTNQLDKAPFMTLLRVEDGLIKERLDFGDYDQMMPPEVRIDGVDGQFDHPLVVTANRYVEAYGGRDFDTLAELLHEDATMQDRTAVKVGGGQRHEGAQAILTMLRRALGALKSFEIEVESSFFFQEHAVLAGSCSYTLPGKALGLTVDEAAFTHPLVTVLHVRAGKVIAHEDMADYDEFVEQLETLRTAK